MVCLIFIRNLARVNHLPSIKLQRGSNTMSENESAVRRRKWKRFKVKSGGLVLVQKTRWIEIGKPKLVTLGPVVNISMGGLSVQYIENKRREVDSEVLAISQPPEGVRVEPIRFRTVSDLEVTRMPDGKKIRTRHVAFGKLTDYQSFQLESFIRSHTSDLDTDRRAGMERRQYDDPRFGEDDYKKMYERRFGRDRRALL